jgi:hypothetical protein
MTQPVNSFLRFLTLVGIAIGLTCVIVSGIPLVRSTLPTQTVLYPLPHQIPKYPGGISFRYAMVHDVLHDRYPRHGKVYYQERNRRALGVIEKNKDAAGLPLPEQFGLIDDLGVGLDSIGEHAEAVRWLRLKLQAQQKLGHHGKALYTTYANLGTFIIHGSAAKAMQGDKNAQESVREGLQHLNKAIVVNPEAHFGREVWQVHAAEFMLAASNDRSVLLEYDMIGNSLTWEYHRRREPHAVGRPETRRVAAYLNDPPDPREAASLRQAITHVGKESNGKRDSPISLKAPVPFDEPCLGIIGMWRLGGGASPQFALALGEIMIRVNQRQLAWTAYQRAIREAKRFSSDEAIRTKFIAHCTARQDALALDKEEAVGRENQFEAELQIGQDYQRAYQKYEEEQIAAGADLDDPHFYDAFHSAHPSIATQVGDADFLAVEELSPQATSLIFRTPGCEATRF